MRKWLRALGLHLILRQSKVLLWELRTWGRDLVARGGRGAIAA